ncbi:hypothetical protein LP419_10055 [Massilia sp. H-1]|nr:hypothetical protein LP419_10055 [Massilia sp. H-1]
MQARSSSLVWILSLPVFAFLWALLWRPWRLVSRFAPARPMLPWTGPMRSARRSGGSVLSSLFYVLLDLGGSLLKRHAGDRPACAVLLLQVLGEEVFHAGPEIDVVFDQHPAMAFALVGDPFDIGIA